MFELPAPTTEIMGSRISTLADVTGAENVVVYERPVLRTPSPSPSEIDFLSRNGLFDTKAMKSWRFWFRREWLWRYIIGGFFIAVAVVLSVCHKDIVIALEPASSQLHDMPAGWLIPIAVLTVMSFPPLLGHEVVIMLTGLVWGFWIGFGITAAGTLLGEIACFYVFRTCCHARGTKYEKKSLRYACLSRAVREGGFKVALISRYSLIPSHLLTAIFSTCGMTFLDYVLSATLSLPKQASFVYLGVVLESSGTGEESPEEKIISAVLIIITIIVTIIAMRYVNQKMSEVKDAVVYARRRSRRDDGAQNSCVSYTLGSTTIGKDKSLGLQDVYAPMPSKPQSASLQQHQSSGTMGAFLYPPSGIRAS